MCGVQVCGGHVDAVRWLLRHGASVHLTDRFGKSPLAEARKRARRPYPFNNYTEILQLLEEHIDFGSDVRRASDLRDEGNDLFREGQYKRAVVKYSDSLKLAADPRTLCNRSQCYLSIARQHRESETGFHCLNFGKDFYRDLYQRAVTDAEAVIAMEPKQPKGYYRGALALLGLGRVHNSLAMLHSGVKNCGAAAKNKCSNVHKMEEMMAEMLQKLQMSEDDRVILYGKSSDQLRQNIFVGQSKQSPTSDDSFSPSSVPGNMCMWCEMLLPQAFFTGKSSELERQVEVIPEKDSPAVDEQVKRLDPSSSESFASTLCPLCMCNVHDKASPQLLRDKYLGGNTYVSHELVAEN